MGASLSAWRSQRTTSFELDVRDEGVGLPAGFELRTATSLGMRIVQAFVRQLNAELAVHRLKPETEFVLSVRR
jgi:two-component sensor histidine kinase